MDWSSFAAGAGLSLLLVWLAHLLARGRNSSDEVRKKHDEAEKEKQRLARFNNVITVEGRDFTWAGRDPIEEITNEDEPRQLYEFQNVLLPLLRERVRLTFQYSLRDRLSGEPVYEVNSDRTVKWKLLGGAQVTVAGEQVLVVTRIRA